MRRSTTMNVYLGQIHGRKEGETLESMVVDSIKSTEQPSIVVFHILSVGSQSTLCLMGSRLCGIGSLDKLVGTHMQSCGMFQFIRF